MSFDYHFKMQLAAPRAVVFERLLRIEHLSRWFCGWCRIEPKVGGTFKFGGGTCIIPPEGRGWGTTIEEGEGLRRFAFTWPIQSAKTPVSYELQDSPRETAGPPGVHSHTPPPAPAAPSRSDGPKGRTGSSSGDRGGESSCGGRANRGTSLWVSTSRKRRAARRSTSP